MKTLILCTCVLLLAGCGKLINHGNNGTTPTPKPTQRTVAVVDGGFDIDDTVFKDKNRVVAAYSIACGNAAANPLRRVAPETRFEQLKADFLTYLKTATQCITNPKLNNISPKFADIEGQFNDWNAAVKGGTVEDNANRQVIQDILGGENHKYNYHGTATAGLIAKDNANVQMILIEPDLGQLMLPNDVYENHDTCRSQVELDLKAQLFEDEDVKKAFTDAARVDADSVIMDLIKQHSVTLVNESYGPTSAAEFLKFYADKGCKAVETTRVFLAESRLMRAREAALDTRYEDRPLHVRAAGNAGNKGLNLESDTLDPCLDNTHYLMIGALDRDDNQADFSNDGRCVDAFTLGAKVIVDAPHNFLNVEDGTSFAAPLMVRYLSLNADMGATTDELKDFVKKKIDANRRITLGDWDRTFAYLRKPGGNPNPNPNPDPNAPQYKEGWTPDLVQNGINDCVRTAVANNAVEAQAQGYCKCAIEGVAKKYTLADFQQNEAQIANTDPLIAQCRKDNIKE